MSKYIVISVESIEKLIEIYKKQGEKGEFKTYFEGKVDGLSQFLSNCIATGKLISLDEKDMRQQKQFVKLAKQGDISGAHNFSDGYKQALLDIKKEIS